jgi:RNA polymerase sigma factor (sigma-70 family)
MKKTPEQIIKEYTRYVQTIAMRYNQPQYLDDMISVGHMAAIQAYERLDESKINNDEKSYITTCIKGSIMNFLTNNARTIHIPANKVSENSIPTISIDTPLNDEGDTLEDVIPSSDTYIYPEQNNALKTALMTLSEKERMIVELHLDLNDTSKPMTLKDIGDILGISRERTRQLYERAITKLQIHMGAEVKSNKIKHTTTWYERSKKEYK